MRSDPIIAVSSPPGRSHRGLVRVSADDLAPLMDSLFGAPPPPRRLSRVSLPIPDQPLAALAIYHPAPRSYTGQDTLELQIPGNPALLERVLHEVLHAVQRALGRGRLAEPGEFTQRAFTAGRIDLTKAEGIAATISATADAQLEAARLLRTGRLGRWSVELVDELGMALALVEAGIDFTDQEDVSPISPRDLDARLARLEASLNDLLRRSRSWSAIESLPWVVLIGPPNAGKSTLFNALLGRTRAVVSDIAGTTRDVLAEPLRIGDGEVMLVDVAGLDRAEGLIDRAMQKAAADAIQRAELALVLDPHMPPPRADLPLIRLRPKSDLMEARDAGLPDNDNILAISARSGHGLRELRSRIADAISDRAVALSGEMLALQPRHQAEIDASLQALAQARALLHPQLPARVLSRMELIAATMRDALDHLGALGGQLSPDDVLGRIFSTFCIGK